MKNLSAIALVVLGLAQVAGDLGNLPPLRAIAAATGASPAPKVFSAVRGLETYSTRFYLEWENKNGEKKFLELTPEVNARLAGPYNRRNVYGAVLAYGPVLSTDPKAKPLFDSVARYALCGDAPLLRELGIGAGEIHRLRIRLSPRPGTDLGPLPTTLEAPCR